MKKKCKKGYSCGKSCISVKKACKVNFSEGVSVNLETRIAGKLKTSIEDIDRKLISIEDEKTQQEFLDSLDKESYKEWVSYRANKRWALSWENQQKVRRLLEKVPELDPDEAIGIAAWVNFSDYRDLNRVIYSPGSLTPTRRAEALYANEMIARAVKKLPKTVRSDLIEEHKKRGKIPNKKWAPPGIYFRGLGFKNEEQLESFVADYRDNVGKVIQEQTHFAASGFPAHDFIKGAELVYKVKAKDDGTGASVPIDPYKDSAYEAEIFYAAGQNFKVLGVKETSKGYEIELEEA